jgi:hypothetical protein
MMCLTEWNDAEHFLVESEKVEPVNAIRILRNIVYKVLFDCVVILCSIILEFMCKSARWILNKENLLPSKVWNKYVKYLEWIKLRNYCATHTEM